MIHLFFSVLFVLTQGIPVFRSGTATGVVRAIDGGPAVGVRVAAMVITDLTNTTVEGALVSLTQTDSDGRYRLENIPPGRYYIQAGLVDSPTFYPGVPARDRATSVQILAGATVNGLDFVLAHSAGVRVSGRVPLSDTRPIMVRLTGTRTFVQTNFVPVNADGTFEFLRVPPGNYTLMASPPYGIPNLPVVVSDKDIDVGLPSGPGVKVTGVVGLGSYSLRSANQKIVFTRASSWVQLETTTDNSGKFELPSVPPGTYSVRSVPGSLTSQAEFVVADREISGVLVPGFVEVAGVVVVLQGAKELPRASPALMIQAVSPRGESLATPIRSDGTFRFPLIEGEYRISMGKLPAGISVESLAYGSSDLLLNPLKLDGAEALHEIRVTLHSAR